MSGTPVSPKSSALLVPNGDLNIHVSSTNEEPQRRRRRRQELVQFPSFDDELRDGTFLQNPEADRRNPGTAGGNAGFDAKEILQVSGSMTSNTPRRVGSQLLDLERGLTLNLASVNEDIVALSNDDFHSVMGHEATFGHTDIHSDEPDKIYVEKKGRFYPVSKESVSWKTQAPVGVAVENVGEVQASTNRIFIGYQVLRRICLFGHGLLAGFALFHCIFTSSLSPPYQPSWLLFAQIYTPHAIWIKTVYQLLVALACFSCLCRIDLAGGLDLKLVTRNPESLAATLLYFGAAALSHLLDITMTRLLMEWGANRLDVSSDMTEELVRWKVMDAVRTGCVGVGWLALACNWKRDRMNSHFKTTFAPKHQ